MAGAAHRLGSCCWGAHVGLLQSLELLVLMAWASSGLCRHQAHRQGQPSPLMADRQPTCLQVDADFYFKIDDDVAVNVDALADYLDERRTQGNLYLVRDQMAGCGCSGCSDAGWW